MNIKTLFLIILKPTEFLTGLLVRNRLIGTDEKDINKYIEHLRESSGKE